MTPEERLALAKKMQGSFNPQAMMKGIVDQAAPKLAAQLAAMEKPKSEGGMLEEGQEKIAICIVRSGDQIKLNWIALTPNKEKGVMEFGKPIKSSGLEGLLTSLG